MHAANNRLAGFLPYRMAITSNAVSELISAEYGEQFGLKIPEWRIMAVLGDSGAATQRELGQATLMDKVAVNRACKALDVRGFVRRSPNVSDGRSHHLELTVPGRAVYDQIWPQAYAADKRIFSVLTAQETAALCDLLEKVLQSVRDIDPGRG